MVLTGLPLNKFLEGKTKSGCTKQDRINKLCAPVKTSIGGDPKEQIHLRDGDIYGDRGAGSYVDDPYRRIYKQGLIAP